MVMCLMLLLCGALSSCGKNKEVSLYDGDRLIKTVPVKKGREYDFGPLEKTGYSFLGWYSDAEGGSAYTDSQGSSAGMTWEKTNSTSVYAHWEAKDYLIKFDYCGATALDSIEKLQVTYDTEIGDKLPAPQKTGCSFMGWYTSAVDGTQITDASGKLLDNALVYNASVYPVDGDGTTLYARWGSKMVTYIFSTDDGTPVSELTYPVGTVLYELPTTTKDNYCFTSWYFDSTMLSEMTFPYTIPDSSADFVTLYANFVPGSLDILQFKTISATGDKEYEVTYSGNAEKIVIPDSYYGKKVTRVRKIDSSTVKEIVLPHTINSFINGAFENCASLEKINIPLAVDIIPEKCFFGCRSLKEINIPRGVSTIGKEAFAYCSDITQINLSAKIEKINDGAFRNMSSLSTFVIDQSNERYMVNEGVLYYKVGNSSYLVHYPAAKGGDTYKIDSTCVKIMDYAFSSSKISSIIIGGKISSIEEGAFENCANLVNVSISGNATSFYIAENAFLNCSNLKAMKIELTKVPTLKENSLTGVSETFSVYVTSDMIRNYQTATNWRRISSQIYGLDTIFGDFAVEEVASGYTIRQYFGTSAEVVIPEILNAHKIVEISDNSFSFSNMEKITVSQYVTAIGDNAFKNCTSLKSIVMECAPPTLGDNAFENIAEDFGIYIKNTMDVLDAYRAADKWRELSAHIWSYQ
ncbi:MAG: leucine-rich repeat protein [Clostridia bacterium]|nr:leucine-rich repeat protein [Clostridia bacterium]